jgi:hypothetical protein
VTLATLPPGNGVVPDLLALAGCRAMTMPDAPIDEAFLWEGCGGGRVVVNGVDDGTLPVHHGHLPASVPAPDDTRAAATDALRALIDLVRRDDARRIHEADDSTDPWPVLLEALASGRLLDLPLPTEDRITNGAWNPLPFPRPTPVVLPCPDQGDVPWGVQDQRGARHPLQVVGGPDARALLAVLPLGALEGVDLRLIDDPVPGVYWEVGRTVLDNGRVRAELDPLGQIVRLCCDGNFIDFAGPACTPRCDGLPLAGHATLSVVEDGPVRGRVTIERSGPQGTLRLTYSLLAHDDLLRIDAHWDGDGDLDLDLSTAFRSTALHVGHETATWSQLQAASIIADVGDPIPGVHWAALGATAGGKGLLLAGAPAITVAAEAGHVRVAVPARRHTSLALGSTGRSQDSLPVSALALDRTVPGRTYSGPVRPPVCHLSGRLQALWASRPPRPTEGDGWAGELLLYDPSGVRDSATIALPGAREVWRVNAHGTPLTRLNPTKEGDAFTLDHRANEILSIRWK